MWGTWVSEWLGDAPKVTQPSWVLNQTRSAPGSASEWRPESLACFVNDLPRLAHALPSPGLAGLLLYCPTSARGARALLSACSLLLLPGFCSTVCHVLGETSLNTLLNSKPFLHHSPHCFSCFVLLHITISSWQNVSVLYLPSAVWPVPLESHDHEGCSFGL